MTPWDLQRPQTKAGRWDASFKIHPWDETQKDESSSSIENIKSIERMDGKDPWCEGAKRPSAGELGVLGGEGSFGGGCPPHPPTVGKFCNFNLKFVHFKTLFYAKLKKKNHVFLMNLHEKPDRNLVTA